MKNLMIFLLGKGSYKDDPKYGVIREIAKKRQAEIFAFNAPMVHKNGFKWFDKREDIAAVNEALAFIASSIEKEIRARHLNYKDLIIAGHSQGAFLAIAIALLKGAKEVIALTPAFYSDKILEEAAYKNFPIYWIEAKNDMVVNEEMKRSYKILQNAGFDVRYILSENSTHDKFEASIVEEV